MQVTVTKEELYTMIKEAVRDVIHEERMDIILHSLPEVSAEEMADIEGLYGKPAKKKTVARRETINL